MTFPLDAVIQGCLSNHRLAQQQLYNQYANLVMQVCYRYATDIQEAQDMVQNTFIRVFDHLKQFDAGKGAFSTWIHTIAVREAIALKRKHPRWNLTESTFAQLESHYQSDIFDKMTVEELRQTVAKLPEIHRVVLMLHYFDGYSHEEIADLMGIEIASSRSRLSRARTELQHHWNLIHSPGL
jgi:RNA polymerase sigma-70 factor, ECF subfamily